MPPSLGLILGPILMGTIVNVFLFGIMVMQCYLYYLWYKQDRPIIKLTVVFLLFLDAVSSGLDIAGTYQYMVSSFGNLEKISVLNVGITPYPLLSGLTSFVVQVFFAWRIQILSQMKWISIIICLLSFIQMLASIGVTIGGSIVLNLAQLTKVEPVALVWLMVGLATDIIIAGVLVYYLRKRRTGYSETDDIISKIVRLTVQTGVLTSACAIALAVAYLVSQSSMHLAFGIPLSKLYTNSLMSTLNMRHSWNTAGYTTMKSGGNMGTRQDSTIPTARNAMQSTMVNLSKSGDNQGDYELGKISSPEGNGKSGTGEIMVHTVITSDYPNAG